MRPQVVATPVAAARSRRFPARTVAVVLVLAVLAGAVVTLQVRGWSVLESEPAGACGSGPGACPRGVVPALIASFAAGLAAISFLIGALVRRPRITAGVAVIGLAAGVFGAQALSGWLHGTQLRADWTAPYDSPGTPATEGVWTTGGSLIRVRGGEIVSYQAATGREQWSLAIPGGAAACAVSAETAAATGLVGYGAGGRCDRVLAVDLGTGRPLWSTQVTGGWTGDQGTGFVAASGDTAVVVTAGAALGYDLRTGAPRWTALTPAGCSDQTVAAAPRSAVVLAACGRDFDVIGLDPASGGQQWVTPEPEPAPGYQFAILSADPVVVADLPPGATGQVLTFGADGRLASAIPAGDLDTSDYQGFGPEVVVSGGLLIGVTRPNAGHSDVVAFRLADGRRQWLVPVPGTVLSLREDAGQLLAAVQSGSATALDAISLPTGSPRAIGLIPRGDVDPSGASVYPVGTRYLVVNLTGRTPTPPVSALSG